MRSQYLNKDLCEKSLILLEEIQQEDETQPDPIDLAIETEKRVKDIDENKKENKDENDPEEDDTEELEEGTLGQLAGAVAKAVAGTGADLVKGIAKGTAEGLLGPKEDRLLQSAAKNFGELLRLSGIKTSDESVKKLLDTILAKNLVRFIEKKRAQEKGKEKVQRVEVERI